MRNYFEEAKKANNGRMWISGEMEIPYPSSLHEAHKEAYRISEACGYMVGKNGSSLEIHGGDIPGYVVLDWVGSPNVGPWKVTEWTCQSVYESGNPV